MTTAAAPRLAPARRRAAMLALALVLSALFVVVPVARAQAIVWLAPVVSWGAAALARSALPGVVGAAARSFAFTTPARAVIVGGGGVTTASGFTSFGTIALNVAGIALLGVAPFATGAVDGEPWIELGAGEDALEEMDGYVLAHQDGGGGSTPTPARATGPGCYLELTSATWLWHTASASWRLKANWTVGVVPGGSLYQGTFANQTDDYRRQSCALITSSRKFENHMTNYQTGAQSTVPNVAVVNGSSTPIVWNGLVGTMSYELAHGTSYAQSAGWWVDSLGWYMEAGTNQHMPSQRPWVQLLNPYTPQGELAPGSAVGQPYTGIRDCEDAYGGNTQVIVQGSAGLPIPGPCPDGYWSTGYSVYQGDPANGGVELYSAGTAPDWHLDAQGQPQYAGCVAADGSSLGVCELSVSVDGRTCAYGVVGCAGWMEIVQTNPERVVCTWGRYEMPVDDCGVLRFAYVTPYGVQIPQMVDTPPDEWTPGIEPTDPMQPYPLPVVDPIGTPWPNPGTNPPPSTDPPGAGTLPLTGTQPITTRDLLYDPQNFEQCMGQNWTWNPVSWVFTPVQCALTWAFVPQPLLARQIMADITTTTQGTTAMQLANLVTGFGELAFSPGSCEGPRITIPGFGSSGPMYDGYPLSACEAPMSGIATASQIFVTIGAWVACALACGRHVAGIFGYTKPAEDGGA